MVGYKDLLVLGPYAAANSSDGHQKDQNAKRHLWFSCSASRHPTKETPFVLRAVETSASIRRPAPSGRRLTLVNCERLQLTRSNTSGSWRKRTQASQLHRPPNRKRPILAINVTATRTLEELTHISEASTCDFSFVTR